MEVKQKIKNRETVFECKLTRSEILVIYKALNSLYFETDEKRVSTSSPILEELYNEKCDKINDMLVNIFDIAF